VWTLTLSREQKESLERKERKKRNERMKDETKR
jgi:hypothetical protein